MKKILQFFLIVFICLFSRGVYATHLAGGEVSYQSVGNNRYVVVIKVFRDCNGISQSTVSANLDVQSSCGFSNSFTLPFVDSSEVSQICPAQMSQSECLGGSLPGMQEYVYRDTITLSPDCDFYTLSWTDGSRNNNNSNLLSAGSQNIYVPAYLYSQTDSDNSSPYFTSQPIPYFCAGNQVSFSLGVVEQDGDSLVFSLVQPLSGSGTSISYSGSYTVTNPFPTASGITINQQTGQLTFTPSSQGLYTLVILCTEYDRATGQILGSIRRDIEIVVRNCTNQPVNASGGVISGINGNAVQINNNTLEMCEGSSFSFTASYDDPNTTDILDAIISNPLPGLTYSSTGTNPLLITFNWTPPPGSAGTNNLFTIQVTDGACPIQGTQFFSYSFNVLPATQIIAIPMIICGNQTSVLNASGGSQFSWYTMVNPGDSIPITQGPQFLENPANTSTATILPGVTTTYVVVSNLSSSCKNRDTITITVVPDFNLALNVSGTNICLLQDIQVNASASGNSGVTYSYSWSPAGNFTNPSASSTSYNGTSPGNQQLIVQVTSSQGCIRSDTVDINVAANVGPDITATTNFNILCSGDTASLNVQFNNTVPSSCGLSTVNCATEIPYALATGGGTNTYPTPFMGFWHDGRMQMIIRASELNALGFYGGKISSLKLNITQKGSTQPYSGFNIQMGCTALTQFPTSAVSFISGLSTVYSNPSLTTTAGLNTFNFNNDYEWDGQSNLVIQFCFDNTSYTSNDYVAQTTTSFNSSIDEYTDGASGCTLQATASYTKRPDVTLGVCGAAPDSSLYSYFWYANPSSASFSNDTIKNPNVIVYQNSLFTIVVLDQSGACSDTAFVNVDTTSAPAHIVTVASSYCISENPDTLEVVSLLGGTWSGTGITNNVIGIFDPGIAGTGNHWIYYTSAGNCGNKDSVLLNVFPPPQINSFPSLCNNVNIQNLLSITPAGSNGTYTCNSAPAAISSNGVDSYFNAFGLNAGNYQVVYYVNGSQSCPSAPMTIQVVNAPDISATAADLYICDGADTQLDVIFNSGGSPGSYNYNWASASSALISDTSIINPYVSLSQTSTFTVEVTDPAAGCTDTSSVTIYYYGIFTSSNDTVCQGSSTIITINSGNTSGIWTISPPTPAFDTTTLTFDPAMASAGNYVITHITAAPCLDTVTQTITVGLVAPVNFISPSVSALSICKDADPVILAASPAGGIWTGSPSLSSDTFIVAAASIGNHILTYTFTDPIGCISMGKDTIIVNPNPVAAFTADILEGCEPLCVNFQSQSTISSGSISQFTWMYGDENLITENSDSRHCYKMDGKYKVALEVLSNKGCKDTTSLADSINVLASPYAAFGLHSNEISSLVPVVLIQDTSRDADIVYWNFGDGRPLESGLEDHFSHTYKDTGLYIISQLVINKNGCEDSVWQLLYVRPDWSFYIPSAFTPNNDGLNDKFMPKGDGIKSFELKIFDRWGNHIATCNEFKDSGGWDGKDPSGKMCQEEVYVYEMTIRDINSSKHYFSGKIQLLK